MISLKLFHFQFRRVNVLDHGESYNLNDHKTVVVKYQRLYFTFAVKRISSGKNLGKPCKCSENKLNYPETYCAVAKNASYHFRYVE